tara:strand:- start:1204 stop:1407 length:204 start_codon:yes stop_codon:yes gene_type:complete
MICKECNSQEYAVMVIEDTGFEVDTGELGIEAPYCPFCGTDIALAERGGFEAGDDDNDILRAGYIDK